MIKEFRVGFVNPPQTDPRLIAKYYRAWNIHQAVSQAQRDFPGEKFNIQEVVEKHVQSNSN